MPHNSSFKSWGYSSVGRAPALQAGCQRFKSANLHLEKALQSIEKEAKFNTLFSSFNQFQA